LIRVWRHLEPHLPGTTDEEVKTKSRSPAGPKGFIHGQGRRARRVDGSTRVISLGSWMGGRPSSSLLTCQPARLQSNVGIHAAQVSMMGGSTVWKHCEVIPIPIITAANDRSPNEGTNCRNSDKDTSNSNIYTMNKRFDNHAQVHRDCGIAAPLVVARSSFRLPTS